VGITIEQQLRRNTITLGSDPAVELVDLNIDWQANPPLIRARVRVTNPQLPTQAQVAAPLWLWERPPAGPADQVTPRPRSSTQG